MRCFTANAEASGSSVPGFGLHGPARGNRGEETWRWLPSKAWMRSPSGPNNLPGGTHVLAQPMYPVCTMSQTLHGLEIFLQTPSIPILYCRHHSKKSCNAKKYLNYRVELKNKKRDTQ